MQSLKIVRVVLSGKCFMLFQNFWLKNIISTSLQPQKSIKTRIWSKFRPKQLIKFFDDQIGDLILDEPAVHELLRVVLDQMLLSFLQDPFDRYHKSLELTYPPKQLQTKTILLFTQQIFFFPNQGIIDSVAELHKIFGVEIITKNGPKKFILEVSMPSIFLLGFWGQFGIR